MKIAQRKRKKEINSRILHRKKQFIENFHIFLMDQYVLCQCFPILNLLPHRINPRILIQLTWAYNFFQALLKLARTYHHSSGTVSMIPWSIQKMEHQCTSLVHQALCSQHYMVLEIQHAALLVLPKKLNNLVHSSLSISEAMEQAKLKAPMISVLRL